MKLIILCLVSTAACIPTHDYEGDYDMTFDVVMAFSDANRSEVRAGLADVRVQRGLTDEYHVDLGGQLCRLTGNYIRARDFNEWPHLEIPPQPCWFSELGKTVPMTLAGSATFGEGDERFDIVLAGTFHDEAAKRLGSATVELTESW